MGEQKVSLVQDSSQMQHFTKLLLQDVQALEYMLSHDWFESDVVRIGAEQEMILVDKHSLKPSTVGPEALEALSHYPWLESELARFNLETNLNPRLFTGDALSAMETENVTNLNLLREGLEQFDAIPVLIGILPTLRKFDLDEKNLTPQKRYFALMEAIRSQMPDQLVQLRLKGIDELQIKHNTPLLEACNTSFQVHLQVSPKDFVRQYNISQALAGPVLAIACNSPLVFGKRLWHENRIALFQQALDTRATHEHLRRRSPRVQFGADWIHDSIMDIYYDDIARFRVLLSADVQEQSMTEIAEGNVPRLKALQVHNSTIYRWNRPCYGISDNGKPHLRIENRVFPAGPTIRDEFANAAFWLGAMIGMHESYPDVRRHLAFEDASDNFAKAARFGMDTNFNWMGDTKASAQELILRELIPLAEAGLKSRGIRTEDIDTYLGIISERAKAHTTGARWMLRGYTKLIKETTQDEALTALTHDYIQKSQVETPIHQWELPQLNDLRAYNPATLTVGEFMETDLVTVQPDDIIELVAEMMEWRKIRYALVEDADGEIVGLISSKLLLQYYTRKPTAALDSVTTVADIMIRELITAPPDMNIIAAMDLMKYNNIGSLPIVQDKQLIGLIDVMDLMRITGRVMRRLI